MSGSANVALFGHWICPFSVRVEFALSQRGIGYQVIDVPPTAVRPHGFVVPREFEEHSPKREIPLLRIDDRYLADSIPILHWLEQRFSQRPLLPADSTEAELVRTHMMWIDRQVYRPMIGVYYGSEPLSIQQSSQRMGSALNLLAAQLRANESGWLVGDGPTLAEALMVAVYVRLDGLRRLGLTAQIPASVSAHIEQCRQLEGWRTVEWSTEQIDEFVGRFEKYRSLQRNLSRQCSPR
jgi:glutathione S-transferase